MLPPEELHLFQIPVKVISSRCQQPPPGLGTAASAMINSSSISPGAAAAFPLQPRGPSPSLRSPRAPLLPRPLAQLPPSSTPSPAPQAAPSPSPLLQPPAPQRTFRRSACSHLPPSPRPPQPHTCAPQVPVPAPAVPEPQRTRVPSAALGLCSPLPLAPQLPLPAPPGPSLLPLAVLSPAWPWGHASLLLLPTAAPLPRVTQLGVLHPTLP